MFSIIRNFKAIVLVLAIVLFGAVALFSINKLSEPKIDFNTQIRPILNSKCTSCHGGVKKAGGISFIYREEALGKGESGKQAIVPGDPDASEFVKRLTHPDKEMRMPLGKTPLNEEEIALIKKWITQGAEWQDHWAFIKPVKSKVPEVSGDFVKNEIDAFVAEKLNEIGLKPSPAAEKAILLRRLSLDLTGLPPTKQQLEQFTKDNDPAAYEKMVDFYLSQPTYGERWAGMWLDLARYADTKGYEKDQHRNIWRYRDYVIKAFNEDKPYDQFVTEQLAGDLLPNPNEDQIIATAFHRNTVNNDEGGTDNEEFRTAAVIDRVNTTFDVFQGLTMSCVQCHSHPYDPLRHKEYYQLMAFLNNTSDADIPDEHPNFIATSDTPSVRIKTLIANIDRLTGSKQQGETYFQKKKRHALPRIEAEYCQEARDVEIEGPYAYVSKPGSYLKFDKINLTGTQEIKIRSCSKGGSIAELRLDNPGGKKIGEINLRETFNEWFEFSSPVTGLSGIHDLYVVFQTNKTGTCRSDIDYIVNQGQTDYSHSKPFITAANYNQAKGVSKNWDGTIFSWKPGSWVKYTDLKIDKNSTIEVKYKAGGGSKIDIRFGSLGGKILFSGNLEPTKDIYKVKAIPVNNIEGRGDVYIVFAKNEKGNCDGVIESFTFSSNINKTLTVRDSLVLYRNELYKYLYEKGTPVMKELPAANSRVTQLFVRGNWQAKKDTVSPGVPGVLNPFPQNAPKNRLGMAQWLVDKNNPLTARVAVNRFWEQLFGYGLVETLEDFGSQGSKPTHPELLDWLAVTYQEDLKWSTKKLLKLIVMSATYRQSSVVKQEHLEKDARNRFYARGPRVRLTAEQIRDQALAVSGLLSKKMYGPSVMPYQPEGIWQTVYNGSKWETSEGEDRYRRALYTYIRRSSPYPNLITFDGPSREFCVVRRIRTNTPLQALATLNDTVFTEASQFLARKMLKIQGADVKSKIREAYREVVAREPNAKQLEKLVALHQKATAFYKENKEKALQMAGSKEDAEKLAPLALVANAILNLDEFITKE